MRFVYLLVVVPLFVLELILFKLVMVFEITSLVQGLGLIMLLSFSMFLVLGLIILLARKYREECRGHKEEAFFKMLEKIF